MDRDLLLRLNIGCMNTVNYAKRKMRSSYVKIPIDLYMHCNLQSKLGERDLTEV